MPTRRLATCLVFGFFGVLLVAVEHGVDQWSWLGLPLVGLVAGSLVGRPSMIWAMSLAYGLAEAVAWASGVLGIVGPYWPVIEAGRLIAVGAAFVAGTGIAMQRRPAISRRWARAVVGVLAAVALVLTTYGVVAGVGFSSDYVVQERGHDCRTPSSAFDWPYEAINYEIADDETLRRDNLDLSDCASQGSPAGSEVIAADGTAIAGWYIPAARADAGPTGPTLVLVHGGRSNKSGMLKYAVPFHHDYNLVLLDLRNTGRSGGTISSGGFHERTDLRAMIDWLERTKHPAWIALVGNSNGAATALAEAVDDPRVEALVLDSMHASILTQLGNIGETEKGLPAFPAAMGVIVGASIRAGGDLTSVDPVRTIRLIGERPVLLLHGSSDTVDRPRDSLLRNIAAAIDAGVPVRSYVCQGARHGEVIDHCPVAWGIWATTFLADVRGG